MCSPQPNSDATHGHPLLPDMANINQVTTETEHQKSEVLTQVETVFEVDGPSESIN